MLAALVVALPVFVRLGLYRAAIRYLPERAIWTVLRAMTLATLIWVGILFLAEVSRFGTVPRSIPLFTGCSLAVRVAGHCWQPFPRQGAAVAAGPRCLCARRGRDLWGRSRRRPARHRPEGRRFALRHRLHR